MRKAAKMFPDRKREAVRSVLEGMFTDVPLAYVRIKSVMPRLNGYNVAHDPAAAAAFVVLCCMVADRATFARHSAAHMGG